LITKIYFSLLIFTESENCTVAFPFKSLLLSHTKFACAQLLLQSDQFEPL
jgi:hypothetical protein